MIPTKTTMCNNTSKINVLPLYDSNGLVPSAIFSIDTVVDGSTFYANGITAMEVKTGTRMDTNTSVDFLYIGLKIDSASGVTNYSIPKTVNHSFKLTKAYLDMIPDYVDTLPIVVEPIIDGTPLSTLTGGGGCRATCKCSYNGWWHCVCDVHCNGSADIKSHYEIDIH